MAATAEVASELASAFSKLTAADGARRAAARSARPRRRPVAARARELRAGRALFDCAAACGANEPPRRSQAGARA
jgi:hypothetical protein